MKARISHYRILERLGVGGAGEIYKAEDERLRRIVALKVLRTMSSDGALLDEARAAAAVSHPNIAAVFEYGEWEGAPFIAMEFVDGETLGERLARGPVPLDEAFALAIQIVRAVDAAHARGVAHLDLTNANVVIDREGTVKVLDFGLARLLAAPADARQPGAAGTAAYMAPEQIRADPVDVRTDVFAVGVLLFELFAGRRPFVGDSTLDVFRAILSDEPPPLGAFRDDAPFALERILRRALEKRVEARYQTTDALLDDLLIARGRPSGAVPVLDDPETGDGVPFRGLLPFQEADRTRFFGRELETRMLFDMVAREDFRFGVLFGDSGSGKTSLVRAGLTPLLWERGYVPVNVRYLRDPIESLVAACVRQCGVARGADESPRAYLDRAARDTGATIVVVLDQFEQFFAAATAPDDRETFLSFLATCCGAEASPVRFLVSIRSDFLYLIATEMSGVVAEPLASSRILHLRTFDVEQAERIIQQSSDRANFSIEPHLARQIACDLAVHGVVLPSELQIVGDQLQRRRIVTLGAYRRSGGHEALVFDFLDSVVRAASDRETVSLVLRALVSDENARLALPLADVTRRVQRGETAVVAALDLLVRSRLVREVQEAQPWQYELMHDYLIGRIEQMSGGARTAVDRANRLFRQYLSAYLVDRAVRIPVANLWSIVRYSNLERGKRERALLKRSVLSAALRAAAIALLAIVVALAAAASLSIETVWTETRLADGHTAAVRHATFSPDGKRLVSCGEDGTVIVWDFARRERIATLSGHKGWVYSVAYSPDGKWIATSGADAKVIVWDAARFAPTAVLDDYQAEVVSVAFSPDSTLLVTVGNGSNNASIRSVGDWRRLATMDCASQFGNILFLGENRSEVLIAGRLWDLRSGRKIASVATDDLSWNWPALSPDGRRVVGLDWRGDLIVWAVGGAIERKIDRLHDDHGRAVAFSPDGELVATGAEKICLLDGATYARIAVFEYSAVVWGLEFSPDGRWLVSTHGDGAILVWDVASRECVANLNEHSGAVRAVAFSPDGRTIASASEDRSIIVWDADAGRKSAVLAAHTSRVMSIAFSRDGTRLLSCDQSGTAILWNLESQQPEQILPNDVERVGYCAVLAPNGRLLAAPVGVLDLVDDAVLGRPYAEEAGPMVYYAAAFSSDSRTLYTACPGRPLMAWDVGLARERERVETPYAVTLSLSPDESLIATGDDEGNVKLWRTGPLTEDGVLGRHAARVKSVAFSPDGQFVASAGDDRVIALWNVRSRALAARVGVQTAPVLAVAFSPDGRRIVAGGHDRSVRVYTRHRELWGFEID